MNENTDLETVAVEKGKTAFCALRECIKLVQRLETAQVDGFPEDVKSDAMDFDPEMYDQIMWLSDSHTPSDYADVMKDKNRAACVAARKLLTNPEEAEELRNLFDQFDIFASQSALMISRRTTDEDVDKRGLHIYWRKSLKVMKQSAIALEALEDYEDVVAVLEERSTPDTNLGP